MNRRLIVGTILILTLSTIIIFPSEAQGPQGKRKPQGQPVKPQEQPGKPQGQPQVQPRKPQGQPQGKPGQLGQPQGQSLRQPGQPQGKPGQPLGQPGQPHGKLGQPLGQPRQPLPGQPHGKPGQPLGQPGQPHGKLGQPLGQPLPGQPHGKPGQPLPGQPHGKPGQPLGQPRQPLPGQPHEKPGQPLGQPGQPHGKPRQPLGQPLPGQPHGKPGQPLGQPLPGQPHGKPGQPLGQPLPGQPHGKPGQPLGQPGQPQGKPGQPLGQPEQPLEQPGQPQRQVGQAQGPEYGELKVGFYAKTCPKVEEVVANVVKRVQQRDPKLPPALLRLYFHDCFVKGCDASILLDTTPGGDAVEKVSAANGPTLRGLEVIDEIKTELEKQCPRTVSCADIIAFAAREAVILAGLPRHEVFAGRRDSKTSRKFDADKQIPVSREVVPELIRAFARRNLSAEEMVVLSGAHSIGVAQCNQVTDRLYKFRPNMPRDPALDPAYADELSKKCPVQQPPNEAFKFMVDLDPVTPLKLDNQYYLNLQKKRGLLQSDQALATDPATTQIVNQMAANNDAWSKKFVDALIKMGGNSVLTAQNEGEIRINCRTFNK